jgi:hypothetical protein
VAWIENQGLHSPPFFSVVGYLDFFILHSNSIMGGNKTDLSNYRNDKISVVMSYMWCVYAINCLLVEERKECLLSQDWKWVMPRITQQN